MIVDCVKITELQTQNYDICIVGAGAIGIAMALYLQKKARLSIALLEKGSLEGHSPADAEVTNSGDVDSVLEGSRHRGFGGSTVLWGGQALRFDSIDFGPRPWLDCGAWPITENDIEPYYAHADSLIGVDAVLHDEALISDGVDATLRSGLADSGLKLSYSRFSPQPNFKERYYGELEASHSISCYLNAEFEFVQSADRELESVHLTLKDGTKASLQASQFVLAGGGVDSITALLRAKLRGIQELPIGHYYNDHVGIYGARLTPIDIKKFRSLFATRVKNNVKCLPKLCLDEASQRAIKSANINSNIEAQVPEGDLLLTLRQLYGELKGHRRIRKIFSLTYPLLSSPKSLLSALWEFIRHKRVYLPPHANYFLIANIESLPVFESVISSESADAPINVHWSISEHSKVAAQSFFSRAKVVLEENNVAKVDLKPSLYQKDDEWLKSCYGLFHHMGGTRMSETPSSGVVDRNLKVHGLPNLYIAGPSVLPTGSASNPTLTSMALSLRLCDHLCQKVKD